MRWVPWSLVLLRLCLGPTIVFVAASMASGFWLAAIVFIALLSDIYDGVLARRWGCDTPHIRLADSLVDTVFYLGVLWALALRTPETLLRYWPLLAVLLALEGVRYVYDLRKFGRAASYHSYLAKIWGLVMACAVMAVLAFGRWPGLLAASMVLGICSNAEGLCFSIMLPTWRNDVKTCKHALALRRQMQGPQG
jgi:phosphatidylglycerophosphate synthase